MFLLSAPAKSYTIILLLLFSLFPKAIVEKFLCFCVPLCPFAVLLMSFDYPISVM